MISHSRINLVLLFLFFFTLLKSQETLIRVPFSQPKKLIVNAGINQVIYTGETLNLGTDAILTGGTPDFFFSWKDNTGNEYTTPTITVNEEGIYYLTVTDESHCTAVDSVQVSLVTSLEVKDASAGFTLFPNPSSGLFNFKVNAPESSFKIEIVSTEGKVVYKEKYESSAHPFNGIIDLTGFDKGVYYVKLISAGESVMKSIIIQ